MPINWKKCWKSEDWLEDKRGHFENMETYLLERHKDRFPPKTILDIGAGLAMESGWLQEKYGCEITIIEAMRKRGLRETGYGNIEGFSGYLDFDYLKECYAKRNLKVIFINKEHIQIPVNKKFDMICSYKSCGFHYPLRTYENLIKAHSHDKTLLIFDIHRSRKNQLNGIQHDVICQGKSFERVLLCTNYG